MLTYEISGRYWCRCDCGTEKSVHSRELKNGDSKSCGCSYEKPVIDLTGKRFGRLIVLSLAGKNKHRNAEWLCKCECGKSIKVSSGQLIRKRTHSCGCLRVDFLKGRTRAELRDRCVKAAKTIHNQEVLYHWKTGEEIACHGSWEFKVINYLNAQQIDYQWQIPHHLSNGKVYIADIYFPEKDLWVDIKGYARPAFIEKWGLFTKMFSNCEVWDQTKLRFLGLKV